MAEVRKPLTVLLGAVLSVPVVAILAAVYFDHLVRAEYASGMRAATDGDSIIIPVAGLTLGWCALLMICAVFSGVFRFLLWGVRDPR